MMLLDRLAALWAAAGIDASFVEALRAALLPKPPAQTGTEQHVSPLIALPGLCCAAAGGTQERAEVFTAAWTLLYAALHLLDSVEDGDIVDAPWARWGPGPAVNISTGLIASSGALLQTLEQTGTSRGAAQAIREDVYRTLLQMTAGQHADLTMHEPSLEACWQIAERKSGIFFALACCSGARLRTANAARLEQFGQFGLRLGVLIQIGNDLEGLWARNGARSDLAAWPRGTLPIAYAMDVASAPERDRLRSALQSARTDPDAEAEARRLIAGAGAVLYLLTEAQRHRQHAQAALLRAARPSQARDDLLALPRRYTPLEHRRATND